MTNHNKILDFLKSREREMFSLLRKMVLIQSGSSNKKGVDDVLALIVSSFSENDVRCEILDQTALGNHLIVRSSKGYADGIQALLVGHMDTVYPADTSFNWYREDDSYAYGPGVADMKGGLVAGIFAIKALEFTGDLDHIPLAFLLNSDEEIGSPGSRTWIRREASKSLFAFVLECGSENGGIVTGRKGNLRLQLDLEGKAGHAAFAGMDKGSAILELSHKIIALESLNDHQRGITVNVGKVNGGIGPNTVSPHATALIDARYQTLQDLAYLEEKLSRIEKSVVTPHTKSRLLKIGGRPPMEQIPINRTLFQSVKSIARQLNFMVFEEYRKGASDANIIAQEQVPVIDGLGPIGDGDHSENERMFKESLVQRTALITCALIDLWPRYNQNHQPPRPPEGKK